MKTPTMYDNSAEFAGIKLSVDPITRSRSEESDNVMAMFYEEQPFTWQTIKNAAKKALKSSTGSVDFLDVGTGSGVFGILFAKHFDAKVVALDKSTRAIETARNNARLNNVELELKNEFYSIGSIPLHSAKVIGLYPPYHLYPEGIESKIPQHARGGTDGQAEFKNQLKIAGKHLAEKGIIFFNQMCLGTSAGPEFLRYIPELIEGNPSIHYVNIFSSIETKTFLHGVYGEKHKEYVEQISTEFPCLYYNVGIITADGKNEIVEIKNKVDLKGRSWQDRILLHKEIADHEYK